MTDEKLRGLDDPDTSTALTHEERLVLRYAESMSKSPVQIQDELFEQLRARFDEKQLVELTSCIAWENYRARFDHALGIGSEGFSDGMYCPLPVK